MRGPIITAIKERKRQDKQQNKIKQKALRTTKDECLSNFLKKKLIKMSKYHQIKSKLNQMTCFLPETIWELSLLRIITK